MSVLLEFTIFPLDQGESVSREVSKVIEMIRESGVSYQLTAMGTLIETDTVSQALEIVERATQLLNAAGCNRIYSAIKMDIRSGKTNRMESKPGSIRKHIGEVNT
ncbi:MAG: MTH1187 family thiamine-binding protein [Candidatus Thiodiazotropha taylori]|nr:MTH1187 family thiamine-binding protein [Candidatus Thiodiazotropha taylori]